MPNWRKHTLVAVLLIFLGSTQKAQISQYSFTQSIVSYTSGMTGAQVGPAYQNDNVTTLPLPFPFKFDGITYTAVNVCSNGYLSFKSLTGLEYSPISNTLTQHIISPFGQDLIMGSGALGSLSLGSNTITNLSSSTGFSVGDLLQDYGSDFGGNPTITAISGNSMVVSLPANTNNANYYLLGMNGSIRNRVNGSAPNRVCEFEYSNFSTYTNLVGEVINFQVRLYETSNNIEVVYGPMIAGSQPTFPEVGLKGANNSDFNSRTITAPSAWTNSQPATLSNNACEFSGTSVPQQGLLFRWSPEPCTIPTLSVSPANLVICLGHTVTLTASGSNSYTWNTGESNTSIAVSPTVNSSYTVSAGNSTCGIAQVVTLFVDPCTGIANQLNAVPFFAAPNPFTNALSLKNSTDNAVGITIFDALGRSVLTSRLEVNSTGQFDTSLLNKGVYFARFTDGKKTTTQKLIKE
jgi:hypothetical protein